MPRPIPVPADKVRTAAVILAGLTVEGGTVWKTCHNCGGSGRYPSSMIPPGQCRLYCWENRTPETFGKLSTGRTPVAEIKRVQSADRAAYRRVLRDAAARLEIAEMLARRITNTDATVMDVARAYGWRCSELPGADTLPVYPKGAHIALDLLSRYMAGKDLSEKQMALLTNLIRSEAERIDRDMVRAVLDATSGHVGAVGSRLVLAVTVEGLVPFDSDFGPSMLVRMRDVAGNVFTTFTGGAFVDGLTVGMALSVKGTVKKHDEYRGVKQTILTRCMGTRQLEMMG